MLVLAVLVGARSSHAEESVTLGVRGGFGATDKSEGFEQFDVYGAVGLPWAWHSNSGWTVGTQFDASAGALTRGGTTGFIGSTGASVLIGKQGIGLSLEGGVGITLLSEHEFGTFDLGGPFQFNSHIGVNYALPWNLTIGYQYMHTSNAGIYDSNPGLDMHVLKIGYRL